MSKRMMIIMLTISLLIIVSTVIYGGLVEDNKTSKKNAAVYGEIIDYVFLDEVNGKKAEDGYIYLNLAVKLENILDEDVIYKSDIHLLGGDGYIPAEEIVDYNSFGNMKFDNHEEGYEYLIEPESAIEVFTTMLIPKEYENKALRVNLRASHFTIGEQAFMVKNGVNIIINETYDW